MLTFDVVHLTIYWYILLFDVKCCNGEEHEQLCNSYDQMRQKADTEVKESSIQSHAATKSDARHLTSGRSPTPTSRDVSRLSRL